MSQRSKRSIRITNPRPGEARFVSKRSAGRMIRRNEARKAGDYAVELLDTVAPSCAPAARQRETHSPRIYVSTAASLASGRYRNDVLGLPNFCGIQPGRRNAGRITNAA